MAITRQLVVELETQEATVGKPLTVRVRDAGHRPIANAKITTATASKTARTDETGRCQLTFQSPGFWKFFVTKASDDYYTYKPTTVLVRAVSASASTRRAQRVIACNA